ncbi:TBCC domain-containing protein [Plasmodium yoelii yoelii]|nr:TBCC domain-containing protein [Plasmodium yoelii yoelii]
MCLDKYKELIKVEKTNYEAFKNDEKCLFIRKEIFDHAIIYTSNKIGENCLINYLKNLYAYFKKKHEDNNYERNKKDEIYISLEDWLEYNELIKNQDNVVYLIFSCNICKSLWILLSITLQSIRKKNNLKKQKTIFNYTYEKLNIRELSGSQAKTEKNTPNYKSFFHENDKREQINKETDTVKCSEKFEKDILKVWNENWLDECICIEFVIFFIILQFLKIDNIKKKYDKNLNEDCWPHFVGNSKDSSNGKHNNVSQNVCGLSTSGNNNSFCNLKTIIYKSNLSDIFISSGKNYKKLLETYLIAFLSCTDIQNSTSLTEIPLYFRNYNFFLLDFIIETNDEHNVYEKYMLKNEYQILYKTKIILDWLLKNLHIYDELNESIDSSVSSNEIGKDNVIENISNNLNKSYSYFSKLSIKGNNNFKNSNLSNNIYEIQNNDIYEIRNMQGKTIYIKNNKSIINILNCKECNIYILTTIEYLKINFCVDMYIICLSTEMITTLFNSRNLEIHLVTRSLKIENVMDTDVYVYTETNIIIYGDTRNIQLAPYNVLNSKQKILLQKSKIKFNEKNFELFAFPLKCKTNLSHSLNLESQFTKATTSVVNSGNVVSGGNSGNAVSGGNKQFDIECYLKGQGVNSSFNNIHYTNQGNNKIGFGDEINRVNSCDKNFINSNFSETFTDYVYYILCPSKFYIIEIPNLESEPLQNNEDNYACLYLPEVYKNSIEKKDQLTLNLLNIVDDINLTKLQKEKVTKILTYKLYEYIRKSKRISKTVSDILVRDSDTKGDCFSEDN